MRLLSCALLAVVAFAAHGAEVYRSVDANGNVVYSDRPEGAGTERIYIATPGATASPRVPAAPAGGATPAQSAPREELGGEIRVERKPEEVAAERARNCASSQERAERYRVSQRLYRTLPNGEREYLSDAELDAARAQAEADVANWCG